MGKTKKSRTAGAVEAAMSRPSELDIVRAECEKAVKSMKNNPPKAQKLIRENCEKHPRVSLGFRYHAYIEKRLAEQQPNVSALKKRHVNVALQAAKRATVLSPNSVEHAFFYANLLQEYMPRPVDKEHDVEAIAECKRALAIAEPDDPAEDMLGELPEELKTAEMRVGHFKHQLRQLSHQMKLAGLQHVFKHVSVDANGNFVPLVANQGLRSGQLTSDLWNKKGTEKTSEVGVEQTSQTEGRDEGQEEQRGEDGGESSGDGIGASQNDGTEETLSELNSRGESAGAEEGEEPGQVPSGESAEPLTEVENGEASSQQEKVGEPCEEDEEEESIKRKQ